MLGMLDTLLDINQLEAGIVAPGRGRIPDQRPARAAEDRIRLSCAGAGPPLARGSLPAERSERSAPAGADDPQSALERGEIHRARQDPARLPAARRQAAHRGLGHRHRHPARSSFARSSRSSISSTIRPTIAAVASASVSPSCSAWRICWAMPSMSVPARARARSSPSRCRSEASSRSLPRAIAGRDKRAKLRPPHGAILVVEDDPAVREMLDLLFTSEGYRTAAAADGKQALALARGAIRPDLIVADYNLPNGMTGLQVIARRARSSRSRDSRRHSDRRHLDRHYARDHSERLRATLASP